MRRINAPLEIKDADSKGRFIGDVAVFDNVDLGDDVIVSGAFKSFKTTRDGQIRLALYHDLRKLVGKAKYKQTKNSLQLEGQLNMKVSYVSDAYELMKDGTLDGLSVGFDILPDGSEIKKGIRYITKAELWEGSIVPFGMNPDAKIHAVKNYSVRDIREIEHIAQRHGCSRKAALAIATSFKNHLSESGEEITPSDLGVTAETVESIKSIFNKLKEENK